MLGEDRAGAGRGPGAGAGRVGGGESALLTEAEKASLLNRVVGMLMHLWGLVNDPETKEVIDQTIDELRLWGEEEGWT